MNTLNQEMVKTSKSQLIILGGGYTKVHKGSSGRINNPSYSRLYYVVDGSLTVTPVKGTQVSLTKGNCYLLPANYSYRYDTKEFMECICFYVKLCGHDGIDTLGKLQQLLLGKSPPGISQKYLSLLQSCDAADVLKLCQNVYQSMLTLMEENQISLTVKPYSECVQSIIQYIESHLYVQLTEDEIADYSHMSRGMLSRIFRQETGMTVAQYIANSIMTRAEQMLLDRNKTITEISNEFGFCDQSYFAKVFKKKYGISPREYKQTIAI